MDKVKINALIANMDETKLRNCLYGIANNFPEVCNYILGNFAEEDNIPSAESIKDEISNTIDRYTYRHEIPYNKFSMLCRELDGYRCFGDKLFAEGQFTQAIEIYFALANTAEDLINSTSADGFELGWILRDIRNILTEDEKAVNIPEILTTRKQEVLCLIDYYDDNYGIDD